MKTVTYRCWFSTFDGQLHWLLHDPSGIGWYRRPTLDMQCEVENDYVKAIIDVHNQEPETVESLRQQLEEMQLRAESFEGSMLKQAKRETLLEAADWLESYRYIKSQPAIPYAEAHELRRMAKELE